MYIKNDDKGRMHVKFDTLADIELTAAMEVVIGYLKEWKKQRPDSEPLSKCTAAFFQIFFLTNRLRQDYEFYHKSIADYRGKWLEALEERDELLKLNNRYENTNRTNNSSQGSEG